tara:strand:+ start:13603 stop:14199 length:597 start_codon:yes stop_codon:yes gene_type:complete
MIAPTKIAMVSEVREALIAAGVKIGTVVGNHILTKGDVRLEFSDRARGAYWSHASDDARHIRVTSGGYGDGMNRSYPLRKDGTFNVKKIVEVVKEFEEEIAARAAQAKVRRKKNDVRAAARLEVAEELASALEVSTKDLLTYNYVGNVGTDAGNGIRVGVEKDGTVFLALRGMTADEAKAAISELLGQKRGRHLTSGE